MPPNVSYRYATTDKGKEQAKTSSNRGLETSPQPGIETPQGTFYGPLFVSKLGWSSQGVASYKLKMSWELWTNHHLSGCGLHYCRYSHGNRGKIPTTTTTKFRDLSPWGNVLKSYLLMTGLGQAGQPELMRETSHINDLLPHWHGERDRRREGEQQEK